MVDQLFDVGSQMTVGDDQGRIYTCGGPQHRNEILFKIKEQGFHTFLKSFPYFFNTFSILN